MGYTDIGVRVNIGVLGPLYVIPGPIVLQYPINLYGMYTG